MSYYGYPNPGAYNYQAYAAAYAGATFDQYQAAAAYNAAAYRAMQQPPLPPGPPPPAQGGGGPQQQQQPPGMLTPVAGAGVIGQQQKPAGIPSISQPAQRYDYPGAMMQPGGANNNNGNNGNSKNQKQQPPYGWNYNKTNDVIAAGYAQSMMNVPAPVNHPNHPNNGNNMNNMRPAQPNGGGGANFQNPNHNRNWPQQNFNNSNNNTMVNNNANNKRPGLGFNNQQHPGGFNKNRRPPQQQQQTQNNAATKAQLTFYCEICKISCAGAQTYKEHNDGQKHKKREQAYKLNEMQLQKAAQAAGLNSASQDAGGQVQPTATAAALKETPKLVITATNPNRNIHTVRCELCDVACSGRDSYLSHIRGSKHLKTLKLHKKLGKPIPPDFLDDHQQQPPAVLLVSSSQPQPAATSMVVDNNTSVASTNVDVVSSPIASVATAINTATQAITTAMSVDEKQVLSGSTTQADVLKSCKPSLMTDNDDGGTEPVGKEYVEMRVDGKAVSFYCKLCDCQFNDPNAKEMHIKGRRHRLSYKKKVDPSLVVDLKGSRDVRAKQQLRDPRTKRLLIKPNETGAENGNKTTNGGAIQPLMSSEIMIASQLASNPNFTPANFNRTAQPSNHGSSHPNTVVPIQQLMSQQQQPPALVGPTPRFSNAMSLVAKNPGAVESFDDRHVIAKHCAIYPSESEMSKIQEIVSNSEKALKLVSDQIAEEDHAKANEMATAAAETAKTEPNDVAVEVPEVAPAAPTPVAAKKEDMQSFRALKGVMRVGLFSKNLMLKDDTDIQLVVLCAKKPTKSLLCRVHEILIKKIEVVAPQINYSVILDKEAETILIVKMNINALQPLVTCRIMLTSASVRTDSEQSSEPAAAAVAAESSDNQEDLLDRRKCLDSLAALRHTKWFQAKAMPCPNCVLIIRILRDLCKRNPTWTPFNEWALELLVERSLSSQNQILCPGEALRRVLECISAGILLPGGPGLFDPCEKDPTDVLDSMTLQVRENITASAQMLLRQLAFKNIYKILDMGNLNQYHQQQQQNVANGGGGGERTAKKRQMPTNEPNESTDSKKGRQNHEPIDEDATSTDANKSAGENMDLLNESEPSINSLSDIFKSENQSV